MDQSLMPASLFYRANSRHAEAVELLPPGPVRFREARHFNSGEDVEFFSAKAGQSPVNYPRVLVLAGSPNADKIVAEYSEWGVEVEVVSASAPVSEEAPSVSEGPPQPDYLKMRKADLRAAAMKHHRHNFPTDLKVKEMREWLQGQPWPPRLPDARNLES